MKCTFWVNQFILLVQYCNKSWSWNFENKELRVPKNLTRGLSFCFRGSSVTLRSSVGKWTKHCDHLSTLILANLSRALWPFELSIKPHSLRRSVTVAEIHITKLISQSCLATGKLKNSHSLNRKHNHMYNLNTSICFVETKYNYLYKVLQNLFIPIIYLLIILQMAWNSSIIFWKFFGVCCVHFGLLSTGCSDWWNDSADHDLCRPSE